MKGVKWTSVKRARLSLKLATSLRSFFVWRSQWNRRGTASAMADARNGQEDEGGAAPLPSWIGLLRNASFVLVWVGGAISITGNMMFLLSLQWWVLKNAGSPLSLTLLALADAIPLLILGPFAGVITDRFERKLVLVVLNLVLGGAVLVVAVLAALGRLTIWRVYFSMFAIGALSTPLYPALSASMPDIVPRNYLPQANALMQTSTSISGLVGYGLSGFVIALFGPVIAMLESQVVV